jgi:hypothetical protein
VTEPKTDAAHRQREADPFIIGLTQHAQETADTKRLADLIEGFLDSDNPGDARRIHPRPRQVSD